MVISQLRCGQTGLNNTLNKIGNTGGVGVTAVDGIQGSMPQCNLENPKYKEDDPGA